MSDVAVEVRLLGHVELLVAGTTVALAGVRPRAVLAVLAASGKAPVPGDRLAEAVYSDTGSPATRTTLQVHVHTVRRALGDHGTALRHTQAGYVLDDVDVDVRNAEAAIGRARAAYQAGDFAAASAAFRRTLTLWRGPFCADLPDHTALAPARALYEELRWEALETRIAADLHIGATDGLVRELEGLVGENPLRERLWGQLMVALYRDGRQAQALEVYRQARRTLADEAGLDPGPALRGLERAILTHADTSALLAMAGPAVEVSGRPMLTWVDHNNRARHRHLPRAGRLTIGRASDADIALLHDRAVSRAHAAIVVDGGRPIAVDLGSRNGTFHNGRPVPKDGVELAAGDLLRCGDTVIAVTSAVRSTDPVDGTTC